MDRCTCRHDHEGLGSCKTASWQASCRTAGRHAAWTHRRHAPARQRWEAQRCTWPQRPQQCRRLQGRDGRRGGFELTIAAALRQRCGSWVPVPAAKPTAAGMLYPGIPSIQWPPGMPTTIYSMASPARHAAAASRRAAGRIMMQLACVQAVAAGDSEKTGKHAQSVDL